MNVNGRAATGFEAVVEAAKAAGPGVTVAAFVDGALVVDLWSHDLAADSLLCTWSAVKPLTGSCLLWLVDRGQIDLDDHVVDVWPEINDEHLLVRHVLTHAAGRVTVPSVTLTDWSGSVAALAAQPADWPAGEVICEHALTFGHLVGEIVRRVDGRSVGELFADEFAGPLDLDVHIGVAEAALSRVTNTVGLDAAWWQSMRGEPTSARARALGPWIDVNQPQWRTAEIPAVGGYATARGLAGFWQGFLDGRLPRLVGEPGLTGFDEFVGDVVTWTLDGGRREGLDIGMAGLGGQWAATRPSLGLAWAFLTSHMGAMERIDVVEAALVAAATASR